MKLITSMQRTLDATTMYRVVLYALFAISLYALALSFLGFIETPLQLIVSFSSITLAAWMTHQLLIKVTGAPGNVESTAITALLLFLILEPSAVIGDVVILTLIASAAIILKYVVRFRLRHIANPAALPLVIAGIMGYGGAMWWVGSRYLLPVVAVAALLVVLKTRRMPLVLTYIGLSTLISTLYFLPSIPATETIVRHFLSWPTIFFAAFMLTEPLSLPSTRKLQYLYATIAAILSSIPYALGPVYGTPELALIIANIFTLMVDRPMRSIMTFVGRQEVGKDTYEYRFRPNHPLRFRAGQYLEWTLPHDADNRGIRRYFTIASAPGDTEITFAVRHLAKQSSWKQELAELKEGAELFATQRAGDFTLQSGALHHVFIAGGIGITPFVSMLRDAKDERMNATLLYCNKSAEDIAFKGLVEAQVKTVHVLETPTTDLTHETGFITADIVKKHVEHWSKATYYISGPPGLVGAYEKLLRGMGIPRRRIIVDYFPGLA